MFYVKFVELVAFPMMHVTILLGGGFKYVLFVSLFGEDSHFD